MMNYKELTDYLDQNATVYAFEGIREKLQYPNKVENSTELSTLVGLLARCFGQFGNESLQHTSEALLQDINRDDALYQLGFKLVESGYTIIATAILSYAIERSPKDLRILYELVSALEMQGLYDVALKYLKVTDKQEFLARYLLAFNTLMSGDIAEAKKISSALDGNSESHKRMLKRLHDIFSRIDVVDGVTPLDKADYRGWHFILTGGLLLHLPDTTVNSYGQYAYLEDSESLLKEGIYRLGAIFDVWKLTVPRILSFDNPESRRLGLAFSDMLGIPEKVVVIPKEAGLFVVYDHSNVISEVLNLISTHKTGMQVYCHSSQFNREYKVAPDFTNLMYSSIISPWKRHLIFPRRPELPTSPPSESEEQLVDQIVSSDIKESNLDDLQQLLDLAEVGRSYAAASRVEGLPREKQWYGRKYNI